MSVQPVGLDLGIGNEPCLVRMGQHHFLNLLKLFELLMHQAPVPARFHHRLAWTIQTGEKLRKTIRGIAFHSPLPQFAPRLIQRAKHAVLLVHIHSNVVHENSFLSFSSLRTGELLSFYLTPIFIFATAARRVLKISRDTECGYRHLAILSMSAIGVI